MNKPKLIETINSSEDYIDFYNNVNIINKPKTNFNEEKYNEIVYLSMYLYHIQNGINTLSKKINIPALFPKQISYEQFKKELERYKNIKYSNDLLPNINNLYQEIIRLANFKLLNKDDWTKVYSTSITQKEFLEAGKIYISVDNSYLYQFALALLISCLENGIYDYEFKVNNNEKINRTDNMVIYFTEDNLNSYLSIIDDLKQQYPDFAINYSHILGKEISNGVAIAKDYKDGSSFTEKVCKTCLELKKNGYNAEMIANLVENSIDNHLKKVTSLISEKELNDHQKHN